MSRQTLNLLFVCLGATLIVALGCKQTDLTPIDPTKLNGKGSSCDVSTGCALPKITVNPNWPTPVKGVGPSPEQQGSSKTLTPLLSGGFIQLQGWMQQLSKELWEKDLTEMKAIGFTTIVIQHTKLDSERFFPANAESSPNPVEHILAAADKLGLKVWIGLPFSNQWWQNWDNEMWLTHTAARAHPFATLIAKRFGHHESFVGWYIPYETSDVDFDDYEISIVNKFFKRMVDACKQATYKGLPVAMSTFFAAKIQPEEVEAIYKRVFKNTGLSVVMVQDGVGEREAFRLDPSSIVTPYVRAYARAAGVNGITSWGIAESFIQVKKDVREPTEMFRLEKQLNAFTDSGVTEIITFDAFHFMSKTRGPQQEKLYNNYKAFREELMGTSAVVAPAAVAPVIPIEKTP